MWDLRKDGFLASKLIYVRHFEVPSSLGEPPRFNIALCCVGKNARIASHHGHTCDLAMFNSHKEVDFASDSGLSRKGWIIRYLCRLQG